MFHNYLITALRNIARHKLYSVINIAGLAVGLACVILIALFVRDELSYDKWVPDSANLYQVTSTVTTPGGQAMNLAMISYPLASLMQDDLPEVTAMTRLAPAPITVNIGDRRFLQDINEVDSNFFQVIRFPLVSGDPVTVLSTPDSIVLSQAAARKFFGDKNPMGQTVQINRANCGNELVACDNVPASLRVTGIMRDLPHNTQISGDVFIPLDSPVDRFPQKTRTNWFATFWHSYVRLAPGSNPAAVLAKLNQAMDRKVDFSANLKTHVRPSQTMQVHLTRFKDVHLDSANELGNMVPPGSWTTLTGLALIGLVILMAACFNFTNLATAWASARAREISLRKCMGASRGQVMVQFLGEAVIMALIALVLALAMVELLLPAYRHFLNRPITFEYLADWRLLCVIAAMAVAAGLASGFYPALMLSRFRPAVVLRGGRGQSVGSSRLRTVLVVLQFTVSITLSIATVVVFSQINFARNQDLGFRRDNTVVINTFRRMTSTARDSYADVLRAHPGITGVTMSDDVPFSGSNSEINVQVPGRSDTISMGRLLITPDFPDVYGMKLVAGRLLSDRYGADAFTGLDSPDNNGRNIMINEAAARRFGFTPQQAVGKTLHIASYDVHIVGVLADARFNGARQTVRPLLLIYDRADAYLLSVRLSGGSIPDALAFIDKNWRRYSPSAAIARYFLDDTFERLYRDDERQGTLFAVFVGAAIFIACLGLFGLAALAASRRTKEIGLRKVFGARTRDVLWLLLWQFTIPVALANLIAWPVAWYYLHGWLQGFAYRITLSPLYFIAVGLAALLIAWVTIMAHALRVARANPIHALRTE
jgi:putative ABC transport system permease protein